jgi:hypothetical protein
MFSTFVLLMMLVSYATVMVPDQNRALAGLSRVFPPPDLFWYHNFVSARFV